MLGDGELLYIIYVCTYPQQTMYLVSKQHKIK
jgi:hypothetical protein